MRYYYLTFQVKSVRVIGKLLCKRFYVGRIGKYYMYQEVSPNQANAFHVDPTDTNGDLYIGNLTNGIHVAYSDEAFIDEMRTHFGDTLLNAQMTEMTKHQRAWVNSRPAYTYVDSMLSRLYMGNRQNHAFDVRIEEIREIRARRLLNRSRHNSSKIYYKGSHHSTPALYLRAKQTFHDFARLVREAIRDEDASKVDSFFVDEGSSCCLVPLGHVHETVKDALTKHGVYMDTTHCECGHFEYDEDTHDVRGSTWCESCFNEDAVYVEDRDEYWPRDDAYWSERHDAYYSYDRDEDDDDRADPDTLMEYSTNVLNHISPDPKIKSSPHGEFLMGIEFEMETTGRTSSAVDDVRDQLGSGYCVCKYDGSLGSGGLEIVTAPRGLPEHINKFKAWNVNSQYRAWDRKCCGMHIHIDSHAFTQMTLGKFIMFINDSKNLEFIRKIAGRHPERDEQARSYAAAESQDILMNPSKAVKGKSYERYRMVNLQNLSIRESQRLGFGNRFDDGTYNTVEIRIFRASLKKERLLAQIEFTHAAVMFCRVASWRELNQTTFLKWLKGSATGLYPHLADWYGVRRRVPVCNDGKQAVCEDQPETVEGD